MAEICLSGVTKTFPGRVTAVDQVDLTIGDGEFVVFVGPSGCGKSTLLRMIAGLESVTSGTITIGGRDVTDIPAKDRDIAMVFQSYALYPHMTVAENIGFGLRLRHMPKAQRAKRVGEVAVLLGLDQLLHRKPAALSGGQRQRVAIGRAMVREPQAFLMDEPLSNLDAKLRVQMRAEIARLRDRLKSTTVYVTHDQVEAMTLGDRVAVLQSGVIQQVASPQDLYRRPDNLFVAAFIGSPSMNLVRATVASSRVSFANLSFEVPGLSGLTGEVVIGIRPSGLLDASRADAQGLPQLEVIPEVVEELGGETHLIFSIAGEPVVTDETRQAFDAEGVDDWAIVQTPEARTTFTASFPGDVQAPVGAPFTLALDTSTMYFFDSRTGRALKAAEHEVTAA